MRTQWLFEEIADHRYRTNIQLWRSRGQAMVLAPLPPYEGTLLSHSAGDVRMVQRKLWRAFDERGYDCGTAESPELAARLLPRVQRSLWSVPSRDDQEGVHDALRGHPRGVPA